MGNRDGGEGPGFEAMIPGDRACDPPGVGDIWRGRDEEKMTLRGRTKHQGLRKPPRVQE